MTQNQILIAIICVSACFFIGSLLFQKIRFLFRCIGRGIFGVVFIGVANMILAGFGLAVPVGINFFNFAVTGFLGIPGIAALYAVGFWQIWH